MKPGRASASEVKDPAPLRALDAATLIIGIVVGAGIFALPSEVAAYTSGPAIFLLAWAAGGAVSLAGALCYAELAAAYPHPGGDYHFICRAFGANTGFLFAWARLSVLQTGSIAIQAFIVGDYLTWLYPLSGDSSSIYAALSVIVVTAVNAAGVRQGASAQALLTALTLGGLLALAAAGGLTPAAEPPAAAPHAQGATAFGMAMVYVLLAYGGWNEAAYISAEMANRGRGIVRALLWSIGAITVLYLIVNAAYLHVLGHDGIASSRAVAADIATRALGPGSAALMSCIIVLAALSTMNATAITGARSNFALSRMSTFLHPFGGWDRRSGTPRSALLLQGVVTLLFVLFGAATRNGLAALVELTAPVFWFFFSLSGAALIVLRQHDPERARPFRVPGYPITPLAFCAVCICMTGASLQHTGSAAIVGAAIVLSGIPLRVLGKPARDSLACS